MAPLPISSAGGDSILLSVASFAIPIREFSPTPDCNSFAFSTPQCLDLAQSIPSLRLTQRLNMYFQFACDECSKKLRVREENIGKKVKCPHCHHQMTVQEPDEDPTDFTPDEPGATTTKRNRGSQAGKKSTSHSAADTGSFTDATEVSLKISAVIAAVLSAAFLGAMIPLNANDLYFGQLFLARGLVPYPLVFLMMWSGAILFLKSRKLKRQKESMLFDMLPNDISENITVKNAGQFMKNIRDLPAKASESFLINRVMRGLDHFRVLQNSSEVSSRLAVQSEIDATAVESSYSMLKVFIWAIPILGFIGTVIGISAAVGGFQGDLADASMDELKESLGAVTGGLSTAFDTTLVALVMSMFVMFPTSSMQKAEEDLLNWVDEYCNENLLKRLKDSGGKRAEMDLQNSDGMQKAIDSAMANHHAELRTWTKKLESVGETVSGQVSKGWANINDQVQAHYKQNLGQVDNTVQKLTEHQKTIVKQIEGVETRLAGLQKDQAKQFKDVVAAAEAQSKATIAAAETQSKAAAAAADTQTKAAIAAAQSASQGAIAAAENSSKAMLESVNSQSTALMSSMETQSKAIIERDQSHRQQVETDLSALVKSVGDSITNLHESLTSVSNQATKVQAQSAESMHDAADAFGRYFETLNEGLSGLNNVLAGLGEKQIVIEAHQPVAASSSKRGWSLFGRRNGG